MTEWPGRWISGAALQARRRGDETRVTNDEGIRCLFGDGPEEYLYMVGSSPVNSC